MTKNNLCPDDYVGFIKKYVEKKQGYTKNDIYKFCVANTEFMDEGDDEEIKRIIDISIEQFGRHLKKIGEIYFTVSSVEDVVVEDYPNIKMNLSEAHIKHIMSIEGKDMNFDFSNESSSKKSNQEVVYGGIVRGSLFESSCSPSETRNYKDTLGLENFEAESMLEDEFELPISIKETYDGLKQNESVDKSSQNQNLEKPYPRLKVTDKTIENIKRYPRFYQNAPVRTYLGKIYKDGEFEEMSDRILSTPLPGDDLEHNEPQEGKVKKFIRKIGKKFKK